MNGAKAYSSQWTLPIRTMRRSTENTSKRLEAGRNSAKNVDQNPWKCFRWTFSRRHGMFPYFAKLFPSSTDLTVHLPASATRIIFCQTLYPHLPISSLQRSLATALFEATTCAASTSSCEHPYLSSYFFLFYTMLLSIRTATFFHGMISLQRCRSGLYL